MKKPRFQLPPRADSAAVMDRWVTGESVVAAFRPTNRKSAPAQENQTQTLASMKVPFIFDMAALLAVQRRNIEAIVAANRVVRESAQAVVRRNLEIAQQAIEGVSENLQTIRNHECPQDWGVRQTEAAIKAYEDASDHVREVGLMIRQANTEAMEVLSRHFTEAADEAKALARSVARAF